MPARKRSSGPSFRRHILPFAPLAVALAMTTARKPKPPDTFSPVCTLPFEGVRNAASDDQCGIDGGSPDPDKQEEAKAKNNFCATAQSPRVITYQELITLQTRSVGIPKSLPDRSPVRDLGEGQFVSYVAFLKDAHYSDVGGGEAVNCNMPGNAPNDIHIVLLKDLNDDECLSTTAEMSPHYRPLDWTDKNIRNAAKGHPVRLQGQLFYDGSHTPCHGSTRPNPKRASLWEIHPVYSMDVCSQSTIAECQSPAAEWTPLSKLVSANQQ
jgi:hypothetical protein